MPRVVSVTRRAPFKTKDGLRTIRATDISLSCGHTVTRSTESAAHVVATIGEEFDCQACRYMRRPN